MLDVLKASYENMQDNLSTSLVLIDHRKTFNAVSEILFFYPIQKIMIVEAELII